MPADRRSWSGCRGQPHMAHLTPRHLQPAAPPPDGPHAQDASTPDAARGPAGRGRPSPAAPSCREPQSGTLRSRGALPACRCMPASVKRGKWARKRRLKASHVILRNEEELRLIRVAAAAADVEPNPAKPYRRKRASRRRPPLQGLLADRTAPPASSQAALRCQGRT